MSSDGYATWYVNLPLVMGSNLFTVESETTAGTVDHAAAMIYVTRTDTPGQGAPTLFNSPDDVVLDIANNRLLVVEDDMILPEGEEAEEDVAAIIALDLNDGAQTTLSGYTAGTGPGFLEPLAIALDTTGSRALVLDVNDNEDDDQDAVVLGVELASGARTAISDESNDIGDYYQPEGMTFDEANNLVLVLEQGDIESEDCYYTYVFSVALTTGARSAVSFVSNCPSDPIPPIGAGPLINRPSGGALDPVQNRLWIGDITTDELFEIDLTTGDRTIVSGPMLGTGPALRNPYDTEWDAVNNRVLVTDRSFSGDGAVISIDVATGDRQYISGLGVGSGPALNRVQGLDVDPITSVGFLADSSYDWPLALDLQTGERVILAP